MKNLPIIVLGAILLYGAGGNLKAATYQVGPGRTYTTLQEVADRLNPGDVVEVDGNNTYPANVYISNNGTAGHWITVRGLKPGGGSRPVITGSGAYGINVSGDYVVLEGFEIDGGPKGIGVFGNHIIVRDCIIHDCNHGLIGYGTGTGTVTVEYCEFYGNGVPTGGATQHQIYMATDEQAHPGSVFRLQYCYLHNSVEGDNVKSRAERNEIYYNWVERAGTSGHGLGLFAPDPEDNANVQVNTAREDADVVGNVIIQHQNACARIGGDTPGYPTNGRYRFVHNTFILAGTRGDAIRTFNTIETLEMYNNVFYGLNPGSDYRVVNDNDGAWVHSPRSVTGSHNWVITGASHVPAAGEWTATIRGGVSPFMDAAGADYRPAAGSPLIDAGAAATPTITAYPFSNPLFPPAYHPPLAVLLGVGTEQARPDDGAIDIGALEAGSQAINDWHGNRNLEVLPVGGNAFYVYDLNGKVLRSLSAAGSGVRIIRYKAGATAVTQKGLFIK